MNNAPHHSHGCGGARRGYTLLELLVGTVASTMLLVGMASAIAITARAIVPPGPQTSVLRAAEASSVVADDLQSAIHIRSHSSTAVNFVLADRNGDGQAENVEYSWDMNQQALTRQFNTMTGLLNTDVSSFRMTRNLRRVPEILGGVVSESATTTLSSLTSASGTSTWSVSPYQPCGHSVVIAHDPDVTSWSIDEVTLRVRSSSSAASGENLIVQIRESAGNGLPTSTVLASGSIPLAGLSSSSFSWETVSLTGAERLLPRQSVCICVLGDSQMFGDGARVSYARWGFSNPGSMLKFSYYTWTWYHDYDDALFYILKGTRHTVDDTSHEVVREYVTGFDIRMQHQRDPTTVRRRTRLLNTPENLAGNWRLNFDSHLPTAVDVDFDDSSDWAYTGTGSFAGTAVNSILALTNGQTFRTTVDNDFSSLITAEMHSRGTSYSAAGGGAFLEIPFGVDARPGGQLTATVQRDAAGRQAVRVVAADGGNGQVVALVKNLPHEIVDLRLVIDPVANQVAVWVNEIFQGRSVVTQPLAAASRRITFGAVGADAEFDFLSVRVGGQ